MGHDKTRSDVTVGHVDWDDPQINRLLEKAGDWNIDHRSHLPPQRVQIRVICGWSANDVSKPALLISDTDGIMLLATQTPLPHGEEVQVNSETGGITRTRWGVVIEEREGQRQEDRAQGLFLNWLRHRPR